jgi:hypothetical protein
MRPRTPVKALSPLALCDDGRWWSFALADRSLADAPGDA